MLKIHLEHAETYLQAKDYGNAMGHLLMALNYAEQGRVWSKIMQALKYLKKAVKQQHYD